MSKTDSVKNDGRRRTIRFGPFTADLDSQELFKNEIRLKITGQAFRVLGQLLAKPGVLVTREELQQLLWPADTFVDFEHGLSAAVNRLRDSLGDSAEEPRYIETLPRRGYRFIGEIEPPEEVGAGSDGGSGAEAVEETAAGDASNGVRGTRLSKWMIAGAAVVIVAVLLATLSLVVLRRKPETSGRAAVPIPFTTLPGDETAPAFSPDGSRIAFAWNGKSEGGSGGYDLYVKAIGSETLLQLTHHPSEWISAAWSPDGTQIAIHRMAGSETGVYVISALGGSERKLVSTRIPYNVAAHISWSPDGKWIAFGNPLETEPLDRIFRVSVETLEVQPIQHNPACLHEADPTFSHDGKTFFYSCIHGMHWVEIFSMPVSGGAATWVTTISNGLAGIALSGDDARLVYSFGLGYQKLSVVNLNDHSVRNIEASDQASWPTISPQSDKIAFSVQSARINIWRRDLLHPDAAPVEVITSTRQQNGAQYSPDGKHIAFESTRGGAWALWMSDADGRNPVQLSRDIEGSGSPRWSPDGKKIAFDTAGTRPSSIYVVDVAEGVPQKLKTDVAEVKLPAWSHDGKWIYFTSNEPIGHKNYRQPVEGGKAEQIPTDIHAVRPAESPDGAYLYFTSREVNSELGKISLANPKGGIQKEPMPRVLQLTLWQVVPGGVYFVPNDAQRTLRYFDLASHKVRDVFTVEKDFDDGISVSRDGRYILYSQMDEEHGEIMVMDRYR